MDDIIQKIIDSEKMAQAVINEAREEKKYHESRLQAEIETYQQAVSRENQSRIARFTEAQRKDADERVRGIEDAAKAKIRQFQQSVSQRRDEWAGALYQKILDGDIG
jgi:hypothetical protein